MQSKNILFVHQHKHVGGGQVYVNNLVKQLRKKDFKVTLLQDTTLNELLKVLLTRKYSTIIWCIIGSFDLKKFLISKLFRIKNIQITINIWSLDVVLPKLEHIAFRHKLKYILTKTNRWFKQLLILKLSDGIAYLSQYEKKAFSKLLFYKTINKPSTIIYGAVDNQLFQNYEITKNQLKNSLGIKPGNKILLVAGRVSQRKNYEDAFYVFSKLKNAFPNLYLYLILVGERKLADSSYLNFIFEKVSTFQIGSKTRILTGINHPQIVKYFQAADLFILPSKEYETFGLITLEAISCGCPTFGYIACANPEIITKGVNIFLAPSHNDNILVAKIKQFLELPEKRQQLLFNEERKNLAKFSWGKTTQKLIDLINELSSST